MGIIERFVAAGPKYQIVFGLFLLLAGAYVAIAAEMSPEHLFSKGMDQIIGFIVAIIGAVYAVIWYNHWYHYYRFNNS